MNDRKLLIALIILLCLAYCLFFLPTFLTSKQIVDLSSKNCPQSKQFNDAFQCLYNEISYYSSRSTVPYKFIDGTEINWNEFLINLTCATETLRAKRLGYLDIDKLKERLKYYDTL